MMEAQTVLPKGRSLSTFFLLAFAISWAFWIPAALASHGWLTFPLPANAARLLGVFGPFLAAIFCAAWFEGRAGLRDLFRRFGMWRVGLRWYLFALLWPALLSLLVSGLYVLAGGSAPDFSQPPFLTRYPLPPEAAGAPPWVYLPLVLLQQMLIGSAMGEEPGWRGYALPRLQVRFSPLLAGLLAGAAWAVWHLPLLLTAGDDLAQTSFLWLLVGLLADSLLFTWLFNHTRGSLLPVLLFHAAIPVTALFLTPAAAAPWLPPLITWALVLALIARRRAFWLENIRLAWRRASS